VVFLLVLGLEVYAFSLGLETGDLCLGHGPAKMVVVISLVTSSRNLENTVVVDELLLVFVDSESLPDLSPEMLHGHCPVKQQRY